MKAAQVYSEAHNKREQKLDYVYEDLSKNNESWEKDKISDRLQAIKDHCLEKSGRKLQKNAEPIREAVVNIKSTTSMDDLKRMAERLKKERKIDAFQIHIHRDEGKSREELNNHAHILFDIQDKDKGTTLKFNKLDLSDIQTIVSEELEMERGANSSKKHLNSLQYKNQQEELKLAELKRKTAELSTKLESLTKDTGEKSNRLESLKIDLKNEVDKFAKAKDLNNSIDSNAKTFIVSNFLGVVDKEKTTENISELLAANAQFKKDNTILKNEVGTLRSQISELGNVKTELNGLKHLVAVSLLNKKHGINRFNDWQNEKIKDPIIQNFINQNDKAFERAASLTKDQSKGL
jgi:hypothetical protein